MKKNENNKWVGIWKEEREGKNCFLLYPTNESWWILNDGVKNPCKKVERVSKK